MLENYRKYIEEPRKLIERYNEALRLAKEGLITRKEFFKIEQYIKKKLEGKYGYRDVLKEGGGKRS